MNSDTAGSLATLVVCGLGLFLLLLFVTTAAPARDVCLTKAEARHLWPKQHIYWYSKDHCWSNRRGPPRGIKVDPILNNTMAKSGDVKTVRASEFNEIDKLAPNSTVPIIMFPELADKLDALKKWWDRRWEPSNE